MRALPLLLVLILAAVARAEDELAPETRVRVWTNPPGAFGYVGEAMDVWVTVQYEPGFLEKHGVALFRRELDLPLHVHIPWLEGLAGTQRLAALPHDHGHGFRFALNDAVIWGGPTEEIPDEGEPEVHTLDFEVRFAATSPGELRIPGAVVRFAYATQFEEDFVGGRVAVDRKDVVVEGEGLAIEVKALPEAGRPEGFSGAVGRFKVAAAADESTFAEDGLVRLTLVFRGIGNFETWPAPHLVLKGFHVYGVSEEKARSRRTITYEIAPTSPDTSSIPAIPFFFFDPTAPAYRVVSTEPIPLHVRAPPGTTPEVPGAAPVDEKAPGAPRSLRRRLIPCYVMWFIGAVLAILIRRRGDRVRALAALAVTEAADAGADAGAEAARGARRSQATEALRASLGTRGALDAFAEFLAAHLDVTSAAVIAPDLAVRLHAAGVPEELATQAAAFLEEGIAARYGGPAPQAPALDAAFVGALQQAFSVQ